MAAQSPLEAELRRALDGEVGFDAAARTVYSTDASNYRRVPLGVVLPRHEHDVVHAVAIAREHRVPILARGGGTALAGQTTTTGLVLDFSKYMNSIQRMDVEGRVAVVQPGVVQAQLNAAAGRHGLFFAPDPTTKDRCTIGGMIGNNSCGAHSAAYGKTVDNVEALDVLLYDGTRLTLGAGAPLPDQARAVALHERLQTLATRYGDQIRTRYPRIPRRVSGYNLDQLLPENGFNLARAMVGGEGSLAIVLNATVRLVPKSAEVGMVVLGFADVFAAADQTPWLLEYRPLALEGFDHHLPDFARAKGITAVKLLPAGEAFLVMELGGATRDEVRDNAEHVRRRASAVKDCLGVAVFTDPAEQRAVWSIRESGLGAGALIPGHPRTWPGAEDSAVPPARLGEFLRRLVAMLRRHDLMAATYYGHFGEGCVHCRINFDFFTPQGITTFRSAMVELAQLVAEFGGSLSGEHGDGLARSELLATMFGTELLEGFRDFKHAFDPDGRMNPGVIVDPEPLDAHLRVRPLAPDASQTHFDFSREGGLAGAALKCVGIGKCRKTDAGTMCPSYMATRDEIHSTRGRARLIYEALSGNLLKEGFADEAVHTALALCLSCKACKSECPAAIDMAAYKAEFLHNYYQLHRRPLATYLLGRFHAFARAGSSAPALANLFTQGPLAGWSRRLMGFHPERRLPRFAPRSFRAWFGRHVPRNPAAPEVLLFVDTFNNFFEPEVAIAATEVLERGGFRVIIPARDLCCARPLYEAGMLDQARVRLAEMLTELDAFATRGVAIVGLEPSCLLTLRDELPSMFPRSSAARRLADQAMLFGEFIAAKTPDVVSPELTGRALVHPHCHQKALTKGGAEVALLRRAARLEIEVPDAGCCGMAGVFGYGAERFALSQRIGERVLLTAIRASSPDTLVIADGFACRTQIRQFCAGREPLHLAQVLNSQTAGAGAGDG